MKPVIHVIARTLFRAGGLGLLTLGMLDSSPFIAPMGNDLLVLALCARYHNRVLYYVAMATLGSLIGCLFTDWISRKSEKSLKKHLPRNYLTYFREQVKNRAAWTLLVASILPPPFPFTAIVAAAAAFKYPRGKLLAFVGLGRLIRFSIEAALAVHYGRWIIRQARSPLIDRVMIALIVISICASLYSLYQWNEEHKETARA